MATQEISRDQDHKWKIREESKMYRRLAENIRRVNDSFPPENSGVTRQHVDEVIAGEAEASTELSELLYNSDQDYSHLEAQFWPDGRELAGEEKEQVTQAVASAWQQLRGAGVTDPFFHVGASDHLQDALAACGAIEEAGHADEGLYALVFLAGAAAERKKIDAAIGLQKPTS